MPYWLVANSWNNESAEKVGLFDIVPTSKEPSTLFYSASTSVCRDEWDDQYLSTTTSARNAVGSGKLNAIDFGLALNLFVSTLTCGSSVNNLQRFVRSCRFVEWIGVVCMMYTK